MPTDDLTAAVLVEIERIELDLERATLSDPPERWRVGSKVGLNVYKGNIPVCQCHDESDARLIAAAVSRLRSLLACVRALACLRAATGKLEYIPQLSDWDGPHQQADKALREFAGKESR